MSETERMRVDAAREKQEGWIVLRPLAAVGQFNPRAARIHAHTHTRKAYINHLLNKEGDN